MCGITCGWISRPSNFLDMLFDFVQVLKEEEKTTYLKYFYLHVSLQNIP